MPATKLSPFISLLIAARNEESTILSCLRSISQLDYPADAFEVLIGDDQSTDNTADLVTHFIEQNPGFRLVTIINQQTGLRGKANVLAQLAQLAEGQYLFFTDADTLVPTGWLREMSQYLTRNVGVVTGVTLPDGPALFHKLQTIDWLYNLTLTHLVSSFEVPVTAMGNNMAVSRDAYNAVGGYESLPFSVVEDYILFQAIARRGFGFRNVLNEAVLAHTQPVDTLRAFLNQRKRWMRGATSLPTWMVASLYGQYLAGPFLLMLGWFWPMLAVSLYVLKLFVQTLVISLGLGRLRQTSIWPYALLFEVYQLILCPLSVLYYLAPTKIEWKGRAYE